MKNTKKILLVTEYYPPVIYGGGEIGAQMLARGLSLQGMQVTVLTSAAPGKNNEASEKNENGIRVLRLLETGNPRTMLGNIKRRLVFGASAKKHIKKIDGQEHFEVIHFLNNTSIVDLGEANKKTVATINSYNALCPKANLFYKEKTACTGCSPGKYVGCITCSSYVGRVQLPWFLRYNPLFWFWNYRSYVTQREHLRNVGKKIVFSEYAAGILKRYGMNGQILPNFTIPLPLHAHTKKEKEIKKTEKQKEQPLTIGYIGSLEKMKGVAALLKAYAILKAKKEDVRMVFVGSGRYEIVLQALARHDENIIFKGALSPEDTQKVYAEIDAVAIPSLWPEPFSRVLLEAYYHGKPVIATAVGGNADYVVDGVTGYLVSPDYAAEELAAAITTLKNRKQLAVLGRNARSYYDANLTPEKTLLKIRDVYEKTLD